MPGSLWLDGSPFTTSQPRSHPCTPVYPRSPRSSSIYRAGSPQAAQVSAFLLLSHTFSSFLPRSPPLARRDLARRERWLLVVAV